MHFDVIFNALWGRVTYLRLKLDVRKFTPGLLVKDIYIFDDRKLRMKAKSRCS